MDTKKVLFLSAIISALYAVGCSRAPCEQSGSAIVIQVEESIVKTDKSQYPGLTADQMAALWKEHLEKESGDNVSVYYIKEEDGHWVFRVRKFKRTK